MNRNLRIAVVGCGLGGAAATLLLQRAGFEVVVYEQTQAFARIGAGIHLTPNVVRILDEIAVAEELIRDGCRPQAFVSRSAKDGSIIAQTPLGEDAQAKYNAPYLTVHRGDFHAAMVRRILPNTVQYGKRLAEVTLLDERAKLQFSDGAKETFDIVIGADGLSSIVRSIVCGVEQPRFSGQSAYRAIIDPADLETPPPDDLSKWWDTERFVISYYLTHRRDQYYFVAGLPTASWPSGVASVEADREEMIAAFADLHPWIVQLLAKGQDVRQWPLYERDPEPAWSKGPIVVLGDACHPMRPHMGQGAAMAIEDAAYLTRCLVHHGADRWKDAYLSYQSGRKARTAEVQRISNENSWLRTPTDPTWVFGYDALSAPI